LRSLKAWKKRHPERYREICRKRHLDQKENMRPAYLANRYGKKMGDMTAEDWKLAEILIPQILIYRAVNDYYNQRQQS
jgi:hypothetical protein